jgi:hypothetical protein
MFKVKLQVAITYAGCDKFTTLQKEVEMSFPPFPQLGYNGYGKILDVRWWKDHFVCSFVCRRFKTQREFDEAICSFIDNGWVEELR